jgi:hypothetical protein
MAGRPPADFGGARNFIPDPNTSGSSSAIGDMAALNLQMLHLFRAMVPDGSEGLADAIAERARVVMAASDVGQSREQSTRELQPITRVPNVAWGATNNIGTIRMQNIPIFTGTSADTVDIVSWLGRIFTNAQSHTLTFDAAINLMVQASTGGATRYIEQMRIEGNTLHQIVQQLEMRFGELCTPQEARVKCNNMLRKDKEGLPEFLDRLREMTRMACRLELDDRAMMRAMDTLVEANIRRVLPSSVRNALEERVVNRTRMGLPAFTAREVEKECLDLEKRRNERKQEGASQGSKKPYNVRRVLEEDLSDIDNSSDSDSTDGDQSPEVATDYLVNAIKEQRQRYTSRGRQPDQKKVFKRAFKNFHQKFPPRAQYGARNAFAGNAPQPQPGPPNKLERDPKRGINELLTLANCTRGQCVQCGADGHYMHSDACALRDKTLVDRPCVKCGKGLHQADDCVRVYQKGYTGPQPPAQVGNVQNEHLND